jgi:peptidoglycan hydrolase CwlO-like protein
MLLAGALIQKKLSHLDQERLRAILSEVNRLRELQEKIAHQESELRASQVSYQGQLATLQEKKKERLGSN